MTELERLDWIAHVGDSLARIATPAGYKVRPAGVSWSGSVYVVLVPGRRRWAQGARKVTVRIADHGLGGRRRSHHLTVRLGREAWALRRLAAIIGPGASWPPH